MLQSIPVWTIPPDWADTVGEGLEWLTAIMTSVTTVEQRQMLRLSPRRSIEFTVRPTDRWRTYFDNLLSTSPQTKFYVPLWHEVSILSADVAEGDVTFTVLGTPSELSTSPIVFIQGSEPYLFEIQEVTSALVDANGNTRLTLDNPTIRSWPKGSRVFPIAPAYLDIQPNLSRLSDQAIQASIRFNLDQTNDWDGVASVPSYLGFPVIDFDTNDLNDQSGSYFRATSRLDNSVGLPRVLDVGQIGTPTFSSSTFVHGRTEIDKIRSVLYLLKGRLSAVWTVFPMNDFTLTKDVASHDTTLTVQRSGFTDVGGLSSTRNTIRLRFKDGTVLFRRIISSVIGADPTTEVLTLSSEVTSGFPMRDVSRISFMSVGRLDQDRIELTHRTDSSGACEVTLVFKAVPDARTGANWDPPPLLYPDFGMCGVVPARPDFSLYDGEHDEIGKIISLDGDTGNFDGTHSTMLLSCFVDVPTNGRGFRWSSVIWAPGGGDVTAGPEGHFFCGLYVECNGFTTDFPDTTGGIFVAARTPEMTTIGSSIWPPLTPGRHHLMISIDSSGNQVQCAVDDVVLENNVWAFGEVWDTSAAMGSTSSPGSQDALGPASNSPEFDAGNPVCINDFWLSRTPGFIDLSEGNRRAFVNSDLTNVTLPDDGTALGITPDVYLAIFIGDDALQWLENKGTGKQFELDMITGEAATALLVCAG